MPKTASRSDPGAHEEHLNKMKQNETRIIACPLVSHADIRAPIAAQPSSPTRASLTQRFTWQMFTCMTFRTSVSYLD